MHRLWAFAVVVLILAGCTNPKTDDTDAPPAQDEEARAKSPMELAECREQIGIFPITHEAAAPYLPDGFATMPALPPDFYQDSDPTGQTATLLLLGFACNEPEASLFVAYLPVVPPEASRLNGAYYHAVALSCIADNASVTYLAQWSVPCAAGAVTITQTLDLPPGAQWHLEAQSDTTQIVLEGGAPSSMTPAGPELIRAFHVLNQDVCAVVDLRVETHEHWQFAASTLDVQGRAAFPPPDHPGLASLGRPGFAMNFTNVPGAPAETGSTMCP